MSQSANRLAISAVRNGLHDFRSDLHGIQLSNVSDDGAACIERARERLLEAIGELSDALATQVDIPGEISGRAA